MQRGLSRLLVLSLDRTPAAELLGQTAQVWADALWPGRAWFESDAERIGEAFRRLAGVVEQWPAPAVFLRHLPTRVAPAGVLALPPRAQTDDERARCMQRVGQILQQVGLGGRNEPEPTDAG